MSYFAYEVNSADFQRFWKLYSPKRAILFGAGIIVLSLLSLRSFGFVKLEYNWINSQGNHKSTSHGKTKRFNDDHTYGTIKENTNNRNTDSKDSDEHWAASVTSAPKREWFTSCDSEANCVISAIKNELITSGAVNPAMLESIDVKTIEMSGTYWVPLFKDGSLSYEISVNLKSELDEYQGAFSGKIAFIGYGLCSSEHLRKVLDQKIAKAISDSIAKDLKE